MSYFPVPGREDLHLYPFQHLRDQAHKPLVIWMTGISASGKSTIADALAQALESGGRHACILDGDSVRSGLCRDLGFEVADREENIRRVAEVAGLMAATGLTVIVALISPSLVSRHHARSIVGTDRFVEVHIDVTLATAELRDPKGMYKKARAGLIKHFTAIDSAYEPPVWPELILRTDEMSVDESVTSILQWLEPAKY
ncbi:adenylyl-sulfate kinase [Pseudomonas syringae]|uniref:Adenylyl-sulfate kinase n=2 Tax=Pseudomonas syringae TaxID=317 RepID=A0A656K3T2_PSESF|nr:adenylyl-sulfate kinase [Pseudomonas syringae]EPN68304.1 adenylyl-sulfate kinase [Pseudomonas syringae pv. actinidiae ICMP 19096]EPM44068.1 adenylyl-sulfate kinase [Pseudomonas syringae pv. actinidiae ICMP 19098]EPM75648.1 adenylyl-sulfate kinase [Pseudomonas syringae pv. actinidiae ICMP 18804]EPN15121.1 adenylyl-sulfate kinase [Pseudomonas syringae pv. actinidiae ICMP 19100]EPN23584.1 adenylyl-sulfate kinase [Pseudomonas syringae pv. actinidiae ICMP 19099]